MNDFSIQHLVEAALYVDDLDRAEAFYRNVLCLELIGKEPGRHVFFRAGEGVLLIFDPDATSKPGAHTRHGAKGPGHAALGIPAELVRRCRHSSLRVRQGTITHIPEGSRR
jgi:catechol 2,3-dioxygenase-like lactoylglutathione lyase family enzyme